MTVFFSGEIGLEAFRLLMRDPRMKNIPMVLETPVEEAWAKEISVLQHLADPSIPDDELDLVKLTQEIKEEVEKHKKEEKKKETGAKAKVLAKGKRKRADSDDESDHEHDD